ncbi:MAG TPA: PaaI family thioesterase [Methylomirabilota bacterium]
MSEPVEPVNQWEERLRSALNRDVTPQRAAQRRVGSAMREVIEHLVATRAPAAVLDAAAATLEEMAATFTAHPQGRLMEGFAESANAGDPQAFFDNSPIIGRANPLAPPVRLEPAGRQVIGQVTYGSAYEGPPGCVHGGYIAAAFDEVLGMVQSLTGHPGMTGTLTVRYRRPTPLHVPLRFEGEIDRVDGRKIYTTGTLWHGQLLTAEAEAVFISVDFERIAELYAKRERSPS